MTLERGLGEGLAGAGQRPVLGAVLPHKQRHVLRLEHVPQAVAREHQHVLRAVARVLDNVRLGRHKQAEAGVAKRPRHGEDPGQPAHAVDLLHEAAEPLDACDFGLVARLVRRRRHGARFAVLPHEDRLRVAGPAHVKDVVDGQRHHRRRAAAVHKALAVEILEKVVVRAQERCLDCGHDVDVGKRLGLDCLVLEHAHKVDVQVDPDVLGRARSAVAVKDAKDRERRHDGIQSHQLVQVRDRHVPILHRFSLALLSPDLVPPRARVIGLRADPVKVGQHGVDVRRQQIGDNLLEAQGVVHVGRRTADAEDVGLGQPGCAERLHNAACHDSRREMGMLALAQAFETVLCFDRRENLVQQHGLDLVLGRLLLGGEKVERDKRRLALACLGQRAHRGRWRAGDGDRRRLGRA
eukprot:Unigene5735_Nuclearia_a/m.17518 Unigene5735_Nuclearia_a/g.17518  ORF Unigene5735_Nuclearia_a/g.17518 Unigene5735_Nuclearia_a/m.17518 type:complete len:409 (+) Unigene5735_Nuclearia_a:134-1360(+)